MSFSPNIYIAVVDDDESASRALSRLLRASGMHPVAYPSGEAFLADRKHPAFDCLLLDINFDGMSGIQLAEELARTGSHTPVIFISGNQNPTLREQALATGCAAYFRRSDAGSDVLEAIRKVIT